LRRSQVDGGKQPKRNLVTTPKFRTVGSPNAIRQNLCTNPGVETGSGTVVVRSNICTNPAMETAGSAIVVRTNMCLYPNMTTTGSAVTVRTNRAPNPNAALATGWFAANGVPATGSTNQAGGPTGTYARTAATGTTTGTGYFAMAYGVSGAGNAAAVTPGTVYTLSGSIRVTLAGGLPQQPMIRLRWKDAAGTTLSGIVTTATGATNGQWINLSATGTAPANAAFVEAMGGYDSVNLATIAIGDAVDFTGLMVEAAGYASPYFTGATTATADFTYAWTGTANASTSQEQGVSVNGWYARWFGSTGGTGVIYKHSTDAPIDGNYYRKVWLTANTGSAQDVGLNPLTDIAVTAAKTYTFSIMARSSVAQHMSIWVAWKDSGGATISTVGQSDLGTLTPNVWQRFSITLVAPTGAVTVAPIFGPYIGAIAMPAGATLDFDQCLIEESATLGLFFTGATAAAGDFTYAWTGTANASTSEQRGIQVANRVGLAPNSIGWQSTTRARSGTKSAACLALVSTTNTTLWFPGSDYVIGGGAGQIAANTPHTWSVYVWVPTGAGTVKLVDATSGAVGTTSTLYDQWERLTLTLTTGASGSAALRLRSATTVPAGNTIWIDDELFEASGVLNPYFDGATAAAGDFTSAWTGTANASTSEQRATGLATFTAQTAMASKVYQRQTGITGKSAAVYKNGGYAYLNLSLTGLAASTTYTWSCDVLAPATTAIMVDRGVAGGAYNPATKTIAANVTTRISKSFTTGAGETTRLISVAGWENGDATDGSIMVVDNILIESSTTALPYFDGATAAAGDFTYSWNGTVNASVSNQRTVAPVGVIKSTSGTDVRFYAYQTNVGGQLAARWVTPAGTGTAGWRVAGVAAGGSGGIDYTTIKAGRTYTMGYKYRAEGWPASNNMQTMIADGGSTNQVVAFDSAQSLNIIGWVDYRRTFVAVRDMTASSQLYISLPATPHATTDGILDMMDFFIVEGTYTGDMIDAANPFSKWDGTADASTTVGYPPQLLDIAGKPSVDLLTGQSLGATTVDGFGPRTIYLVYEAFASAIAYPNNGTYGVGGTKGLTFQYSGIGGTALFPRFDFPGATLNMGQNLTGGRLFRRHVVAYSFPQGLTPFQGMLNGAADVQGVPTSGVGTTGWDDGRATLATTTDGAGIRMLVYYAEHSRATRLAISRYLGNKYGAYVA
jgi:hypothetical protein